MTTRTQFLKKVELKYYYLILLLVPSLIYLFILILVFKFTNRFGTLLVLNVLFLVIFENLLPLIEERLGVESRIGENNIEEVTNWVRVNKQRIVLVFSILVILIGVTISLSNTILQWNWKYTSVMWLVYFTFAFPISALLPPRESE